MGQYTFIVTAPSTLAGITVLGSPLTVVVSAAAPVSYARSSVRFTTPPKLFIGSVVYADVTLEDAHGNPVNVSAASAAELSTTGLQVVGEYSLRGVQLLSCQHIRCSASTGVRQLMVCACCCEFLCKSSGAPPSACGLHFAAQRHVPTSCCSSRVYALLMYCHAAVCALSRAQITTQIGLSWRLLRSSGPRSHLVHTHTST
jgi:hypothetical protein